MFDVQDVIEGVKSAIHAGKADHGHMADLDQISEYIRRLDDAGAPAIRKHTTMKCLRCGCQIQIPTDTPFATWQEVEDMKPGFRVMSTQDGAPYGVVVCHHPELGIA